jgi:Flp pilus assembly protein TadD
MSFSRGFAPFFVRSLIPAFFTFLLLAQSGLASTISGFIYDKNRNPLSQVDVELLNENYQMRGRTKSDPTGRYTFSDLSDGRYTIRVLPFRYDLEDQDAMVEIITLDVRGGTGNMQFTQDFYLSPKRGGLTAAENAVIFAQDIPAEARKLYDSAVSDLASDRRADGIRGLRNAIAAFPKYFNAIHRLGKELIFAGEYGEAAQLMIKAADINSKSAMSLFYAGSALHSLGPQYDKGALVALRAALELADASVPILYLMGTIERATGDLVNAEKHLLRAKKLTKQPIPELHKELAQLYGNDLKKYDEAAAELELYVKASKLSPEEEKKTKQVIASLRQKGKATSSNKP